jgi:hypothetical protein
MALAGFAAAAFAADPAGNLIPHAAATLTNKVECGDSVLFTVSIDLPDVVPGNLQINNNPRNGRPYFNTSLFSPNALGTPGNAARRSFYGPGMDNYDVALHKIAKFTESKTLELRFETFNAFNHAQFFGGTAVDGNINSATFGYVTHAAPPRISQVA